MSEGDKLPDSKAMAEMLVVAQNSEALNKARTHYMTEMEKLCGDGRPYVAIHRLRTEHKRLKGEAMVLFNGNKTGGPESDNYRASLEKEIKEAYKKFQVSNDVNAK